MVEITSTPKVDPQPDSSIEEALMNAAANHAAGIEPIEMLFMFALTPDRRIVQAVIGHSNLLTIRGAISEIHDALEHVEDEVVDKSRG